MAEDQETRPKCVLVEPIEMLPRKHWYHKILVAAWIRCSCGGMQYVDGTIKLLATTPSGPPCGHCGHTLDFSILSGSIEKLLHDIRQEPLRN